MKKLFLIAFTFICLSAQAQKNLIDKALSRFNDPENPENSVFLAKGGQAIGISGSYKMFDITGDNAGDGYAILSVLNLGEGKFHTWNVYPSFSWFVADDVSLGVRLNYGGYLINTNIQLDFRDVIGGTAQDDYLNLQISRRHMVHHKGGAAFTARRYKSLFGSQMLGVFAEARAFGSYGVTSSNPIPKDGGDPTKIRLSNHISLGVGIAGGLAVKLKDNSVLTLSIPLIGAAWEHSRQQKYWTIQEETGKKTEQGGATMNRFQISRTVDASGIQVGYVRYIFRGKNKKK